jgi:hypothetical protein
MSAPQIAGDDFEPFEGGLLNFVRQRAFAEQRAVATRAFNFFQAKSARRVGLGIEIEEQHLASHRGQAGGQIDGGGGFSHAALLVGDGYHAS